MPGSVRLKIVQGPMTGKEFLFEEHDTFLFGRHPECHVALPDDGFVSRHHFILELNPPDARVRDMGSLNGTLINGVKCGGRGPGETPESAAQRTYPQLDLRHGDRLQIGNTVLEVDVQVPGATAQGVTCRECGRDVSAETGRLRTGDYVCSACRNAAAHDPLRFVKRNPCAGTAHDDSCNIPGYQVERKLGEGGMGAVYLARRIADGGPVALKVMLSRVAVDERSRETFCREIEVQRSLRHHNLVSLEQSGCEGSTFWFAMEYCDQGSVVDWMNRYGGTLPIDIALSIALDALAGLAHAHNSGFVHRDIKPPNLLLHGYQGRLLAKIADFGLAKNFEKAGLSGMTATGSYSGAYPFLATEQVTDFKSVRPATDVWAMAATAYFMLTGCPPREHQPGRDPLQEILQGRLVDVRERRSDVPGALARVLNVALATGRRATLPGRRPVPRGARRCRATTAVMKGDA